MQKIIDEVVRSNQRVKIGHLVGNVVEAFLNEEGKRVYIVRVMFGHIAEHIKMTEQELKGGS